MKNYLNKNILRTLLSTILILTLCLITACSNDSTTASADSSTEKKDFIVGFDAEYPPFGYLAEDGKTYKGFDLDLAEEVCKRTGMNLVKQPIDWDSKDAELNSEAIDCIWSGFTINGRENDYLWSIPYIDNSIVLIVRSDSDINSKSDLKGKIVMVQAGSSGKTALNDESNAEFVKSLKELEECADYNSAFMNLESGVVDCVAVDIGVAKYNLENKKGIFKQLTENVSTEKYGIGFRKGDETLKNKVEGALIEMWKDGTFMNIANKYSDYALADTVCIGEYIK